MKNYKYIIALVTVLVLSIVIYRAYTFEVETINSQTKAYNEPELRVSPYGVQDKFIDWIIQTKYDLNFWLYRLSLKEAEQLLKNLSSLGLNITRIGENRPYEGLDKEFLKLKDRFANEGVSVIDDEHLGLNFNHTKTYIADDNRFLITTANLTYTSMRKNREYRYADTHTGIVASLNTMFEKDLTGKDIELQDIHTSLLVCPINCREEIMKYIDEATLSIDIAVQYLQDQQIRNQLLQKSKQIPIRILLGFRQDDGRLQGFGPEIVKILPEPYLHTKNLLIDGRYLLHGSMNMSSNSLDNNREIGIIIEDPKSIEKFSRQFDVDWESGISHISRDFDG